MPSYSTRSYFERKAALELKERYGVRKRANPVRCSECGTPNYVVDRKKVCYACLVLADKKARGK